MARYILIDNNTGYIFGDTADINGKVVATADIADAARILDEQVVGEHGRTYEVLSGDPGTTATGYQVYRADVDGSAAVPVVHDGQDQDTIDAVIASCRYEGFVSCTSVDQWD